MLNGRGSVPPNPTPLSVSETLAGKRIVVIGGTGFLGKVFWVMLLARFPGIQRLHLVVRARQGQDASTRFWQDIVPGHCLDPLREAHGDRFETFLREKVEVVEGDIVQPYCGIEPGVRDEWRGKIDVLVNASGIVDFQPPLDIALEVNAFGVQSLVALARDLGDVPVMHTSTCYVAGFRTGIVEESDPLEHPFPYAGKLERAHWDPDREIDECLDIIRQARHRAGDAFRQSHFLYQAKQNLNERGEPVRGKVLEAEIERVRRRFIEEQLAELGQERAQFWGWANTYTYTKSIGEQIAARSGLPFTIVRPAIIESCVEFPVRGWNEGINTSAPLIFAIRRGQFQLPGSEIRLDIVPCDMVSSGMLLALAELLRGEQKPVYQFGTSDSNPTSMARIFELSGLYKRKYYRRTGSGGPLVSALQGHIEGALLSPAAFDRFGPRRLAAGAQGLARMLRKSSGSLASLLEPIAEGLNGFARSQIKIYDIVKQFEPFVATLDYEFRCDNTRAAFARLAHEDRARLIWAPEALNWREWFLETHAPGLERWVFPEMDKRLQKPVRALRRYDSLVDLLAQMAERHDLAPALCHSERDGFSRVSYREWHERARAAAWRLVQAGVRPGDRVLLAGKNHPDWVIAAFGIAFAGAVLVPLDADVSVETARAVRQSSGARVALLDAAATASLLNALSPQASVVSLSQLSERGPSGELPQVRDTDVALLTTTANGGEPKSVMFTHANLCSMVASLAPLFPLGKSDHVLSVLPLHQTLEITCGLLLPMSRGSRILYLDQRDPEQVSRVLKDGRVTAMVGVPPLWETMEQQIRARVGERGRLAKWSFELALDYSRKLSRQAGLDLGRLLFWPVHRELGGNLRFLVSSGVPSSESTQRFFAGLGLNVLEGYGLAEVAPVLSVARGGVHSKPRQFGLALPDVEIRISAPDADGVGEVLVRGPGVASGYWNDPDATRAAVDAGGWLHTGDLGKLDERGRLSITGRLDDANGAPASGSAPSDDEPRSTDRPRQRDVA